MHVETLIALAIQKTERNSLRSLAERLEVSSSKVSEWKTGQAPIPEARITQLARLIGQDPGPWLLLVKSEQGEAEVSREWAKLARKLAATATLLAVVVLPALSARAQAVSGWVQTPAVVYIMRNCRWWAHCLGLWLRVRFGKPAGPYIEAKSW